MRKHSQTAESPPRYSQQGRVWVSVGLFMSSVPLRAWHVSCQHKNYSAIIWRKLQSALLPPPKGLRIECSGEMSIFGNTDPALSLLLYIDYHSILYLWITNFHTINIWELWGHGSHAFMWYLLTKMASNDLLL